MKSIKNIEDISIDQEVFNPKLKKYFVVLWIKKIEQKNDWLINLKPSSKNPEEVAGKKYLSDLVELGYKKVA